MGSPDAEPNRDLFEDHWEGPVHAVTLDLFLIAKQHEVTQAQYEAVMGSNHRHPA